MSGPASVSEIRSVDEMRAWCADGAGVLLFYASWHEPSRPNGQLQQLLSALAASGMHAPVKFGVCEAEACPQLSLLCGVEVVPTFVSLRRGEKVEAVVSSEAGDLMAAIQRLKDGGGEAGEAESAEDLATKALNERLRKLIDANVVMLFMKGSPAEPRCKFSRRMVELLQSQEMPFGSFDILTDDAVRQGLKAYSNWPTYPQLYVRGELVGGIDVVNDMISGGAPLKEQLELSDEALATEAAAPAAAPSLEDRLRTLIGSAPAMLFMKGSPDAPKCGFSRRIVELLREEQWDFGYFDILSDNEVRQGLKTFSDWPTYPQLYVKGELLGGLDLVQEMKESGDLKDVKP